MAGLIDFFAEHRAGVGVLLASGFAATLLLQWVCWIAGWGRFTRSAPGPGRQELRVVVTDFFVKIIDDFRHLLALIVVVVFVVVLVIVLWPGMMGGNVASLEQGLKSVVASLGGLIATILGYYFGESAGARRASREAPPVTEQMAVMPPPAPAPPEIKLAPAPPAPPGGKNAGGG
jgi:hypothetical protein